MIEAILVAMMTTITAFVLIFLVDDCQPLGKDPNTHPLQVNLTYTLNQIDTDFIELLIMEYSFQYTCRVTII